MTDGEACTDDRDAVIHGEARAVLDAQNATMTDIDGKAMKTVRYNAILIGLLLSASRIAGPGRFDARLLGVSILALVCSTVVGIVTYNESTLYVGPGGYYFETAAREGRPESPCDGDLLQAYAGMIYDNRESIDWNAKLLSVTQVTLIIGIIAAVLAAAI